MTTLTTFISTNDRQRPGVRAAVRSVQVFTLILLLLIGIGPLYWMVKGAVSPPTELTTQPLALWPDRCGPGQLLDGVHRSECRPLSDEHLPGGRRIVVRAALRLGHGGLRPFGTQAEVRQGRLRGDPRHDVRAVHGEHGQPLHDRDRRAAPPPQPGRHLLGDLAATATNAFTVLLAKQFFDALPKELFDAARVDGASTRQLLTKIVLPMSKPVLAVISLLAVMHSWKDFIWPLVAITDPERQPISVALAQLATQAPQDQLIATMVLAVAPPVLVFVVCQKYIVAGLGFTGVKG